MTTDSRRSLPSVSALLEVESVRPLLGEVPRSIVVDAIRTVIDDARRAAIPVTLHALASDVVLRVSHARRRSLRHVINATGVVLHTNLGRAPLASVAIEAMTRVATGYSNLEYDLNIGARGSRYAHCASLLCELTGAADALVVNNCAAALVLALNTVSDGRDALLSRGELVEIGGSFRVQEIMAKSGATLREVGSTNRTHLADYTRAVNTSTGAILKVHRSNFAIEGFVAETDVASLVPTAHEFDIPIIHDLGSGLLMSLATIGLVGEPTAREALASGASIVTMSGDKLLGGPQAGILLGNSRYLSAMRSNPLARSYRVDKFTLAALEATLGLYREPSRALAEIPALSMLGAPLPVVQARAAAVLMQIAEHGVRAELVSTQSMVGAGAFPRAAIPSVAIALAGTAARWTAALRTDPFPVIPRVHEGRVLLDMRTVADSEIQTLVTSVIAANA